MDNVEKLDHSKVYKDDFELYIDNYCIEHEIDKKDISPLNWIAILLDINEMLIEPNKVELLKVENNISGQYDKNKVLHIYNIYKRLCLEYNQEISQHDFLELTGIDKQTLYNWRNEHELGSSAFDLHEKIQEDNRTSLEKLMFDRRNNPMKFLPKLNRYHGYNGMNGQKEITKITALTTENLPTLSADNCLKIANNSDTQNE